ncbi:MAG: hypothetical protein AAGA48_13510 [Myxococcota bacterium]
MLALLALLSTPTFAQPVDDNTIELAEKLTTKLGVTPEVAAELTVMFEDHRTVMTAHREALATALSGLREARSEGNASAMKRLIKEIQRLKDRGHELNNQHHDDVLGMLTVDQQAQWLLFQAHRTMKRRSGGLPKNPR